MGSDQIRRPVSTPEIRGGAKSREKTNGVSPNDIVYDRFTRFSAVDQTSRGSCKMYFRIRFENRIALSSGPLAVIEVEWIFVVGVRSTRQKVSVADGSAKRTIRGDDTNFADF